MSPFLADLPVEELESQTYSYWSEFVNMMMTLGIILVLIVLTVWILKRIMRSRIKSLNRSTQIKIHERRILGPKSFLYLVEVLGKGLVVSESQNGIHKIAEFGDEVNIEALLEEAESEEKAPRVSFKEMMKQKMQKLKPTSNA